MAELCRHTGTRGLAAAMIATDGTERGVLAESRFAEPSLGTGDTGLWRFSWTAVQPHRRDDPVGSSGACADSPPGPEAIAARVGAMVADDLGRAWPLTDLARRLALSERTLQRRLSQAGTTLADLVRATRVEAAGRLLIDTAHSLGKVGFACGFSDQAHFTKLFKRQTVMMPAAYRNAFAPLGRVR